MYYYNKHYNLYIDAKRSKNQGANSQVFIYRQYYIDFISIIGYFSHL